MYFYFFFLILFSYLNFMQLDNLYVMYGLLALTNLNQQNLYTNVKRIGFPINPISIMITITAVL